MTEPRLVTDEEAALARQGVNVARTNPFRTSNTTFLMVPVEDWLERLLATRAALIEDDERLRELLGVALRYIGAGEHDCTGPEDCWTCAVAEALASPLPAELRGNREQAASLFTDRDSTSGTSTPPETEKG